MLNPIDCNKIEFIRLTDDYEFKPFDCGHEDLNNFLFNDSKLYARNLRYTTTVLELEDKIVGYYSLANDLLNISDVEELQQMDVEFQYQETFAFQKMFPAVKIGRLAVDVAYQSKGIGAFIINTLVKNFSINNKTGCQFITVDALNNIRTMRFYESHGFELLTLNDIHLPSRVMYKLLVRTYTYTNMFM